MFEMVGNFFRDYGMAMQGKDPKEQRMRLQAIETNKQFAILRGDFSPEDKENAARKIIQVAQPKLYEQRLRQDPNAKFYQPILSREEQKQKALGSSATASDFFVQGAVDIGKIEAAREKFTFRKITPEVAEYFTAAEKSVLDRMKSAPTRDNRDYFAPGDETDVITALGKKKKYEAPTEWLRTKEVPEVMREAGRPLADFFQAATETVPEENIPKTHKQLGITSIEDQKTFQEMQNALPDRDLRLEYENDPESMQRLIQLWKARKINKSNLHKFFSAIQQQARQALGIA